MITPLCKASVLDFFTRTFTAGGLCVDQIPDLTANGRRLHSFSKTKKSETSSQTKSLISSSFNTHEAAVGTQTMLIRTRKILRSSTLRPNF
jgi:hypothetical protein